MTTADDLVAQSLANRGEVAELAVESEDDDLVHELLELCSSSTKPHSKSGMDSLLFEGETVEGPWKVRVYIGEDV